MLWHTEILHRTFSQMNVKLSSRLWTCGLWTKTETFRSQKTIFEDYAKL